MILTIDVNEVFWFLAKVFLCLLVFWVILTFVLGYFYDHYCGDKSTKEYKERKNK